MIRTLCWICLFAVVLVLGRSETAAGTVQLWLAGEPVEIEEATFTGEQYVSLSELVRALDGSIDWLTPGFAVRCTIDRTVIDLTVDSPYLSVNGSALNMTLPARLQRGELFVPLATFLPLYNRSADMRLDWQASARTIRAQSGGYSIVNLAAENRANGFLLELELTDSLAYDVFVTEGNWINISVRGATANAQQIESHIDRRFMRKVSVHQQAGTAQVSVQLRQSFTKWHHRFSHNPERIQISIPDLSFTLDSTNEQQQPASNQEIDVIIVDAGHGGRDNGAVGRGGTREKDITLQIARETARLLRAEKRWQVIMTRDSDETVSLDTRAEIANRAKGDLFLSIHCNAHPKRSPRGWNVFFLASARNDSARAVEQLENSYFVREIAQEEALDSTEEADPILGILNDMIMTEFQAESQEFALLLDSRMRKNLTIPARGVDQAGFFVLNKIFMPSVLIETAFISNATEEKLLKSRAFQAAVAKSIVEAVIEFTDKYAALEGGGAR